MTRLTKTLLGLAVVSFAIGFGTDWLWGFGKPAGVILFGLFMISKVFEKEVAKFNKEESQRLARADHLKAAEFQPHSHEPLRRAA